MIRIPAPKTRGNGCRARRMVASLATGPGGGIAIARLESAKVGGQKIAGGGLGPRGVACAVREDVAAAARSAA